MMYVQCEIRKKDYQMITWIEEKFAEIGTKVRVKSDNENWDDGWVVTKTWGKINKEQALKMKELYKHHRKGTDI